METFRRLPRFMEDKRDQKAKDVKNSWLTKKYFFGNDSPATREGQDLVSVHWQTTTLSITLSLLTITITDANNNNDNDNSIDFKQYQLISNKKKQH